MKKNFSKYYPITFSHIYKSALWGGNKISSFRNDLGDSEGQHIAESWEVVDRNDGQSHVQNGPLRGKSLRALIENDPEGIVGEGHKSSQSFPLLCKIIDAKKDLSLQVHPNEKSCKHLKGAEPKTEMWYVLDHDEDAEILNGIKKDVTNEEFCNMLNSPNIRELMNSYKSKKGNSYLIQATKMHSIGGGNLIYEIQQNSNTTYRVSDWGRRGLDGKPRKLHLDEAKTCLAFSTRNVIKPEYGVTGLTQKYDACEYKLIHKSLSVCQFFIVDELNLEGKISVFNTSKHFQTIYAIDNDLEIKSDYYSLKLKKGHTCLLPAGLEKFDIISSENSSFLRAKVA